MISTFYLSVPIKGLYFFCFEGRDPVKKVLLIESQAPYREGLKFILQMKFPEIIVEAESTVTGLKLTEMPDLVLINSSLTLTEGMMNLLRKFTKIAFLVNDKQALQGISSIEKISGFLLKSMSSAELVHAVDSLLSGKDYVHPTIGNWVLEKYRNVLDEHMKDKNSKMVVNG